MFCHYFNYFNYFNQVCISAAGTKTDQTPKSAKNPKTRKRRNHQRHVKTKTTQKPKTRKKTQEMISNLARIHDPTPHAHPCRHPFPKTLVSKDAVVVAITLTLAVALVAGGLRSCRLVAVIAVERSC
jgi:hypothetical protein